MCVACVCVYILIMVILNDDDITGRRLFWPRDIRAMQHADNLIYTLDFFLYMLRCEIKVTYLLFK